MIIKQYLQNISDTVLRCLIQTLSYHLHSNPRGQKGIELRNIGLEPTVSGSTACSLTTSHITNTFYPTHPTEKKKNQKTLQNHPVVVVNNPQYQEYI